MGKDNQVPAVGEASTQEVQDFLKHNGKGGNDSPFAVLLQMVAEGKIVLATEGEIKEISEAPAVTAPTPAASPTTPTTPTAAPMTKAGLKEYNDFFGLFAKHLREGGYFRPLGFIPGPAVILDFRRVAGKWEVQILAATSDVAQGMQIPTPWIKQEQLPEKMIQSLAEHKAVVDGLGHEPSPYSLGLARALLGGELKNLVMIMPRFRYRPGDPEFPFGVALVPEVEGGLKLRAYNPQNIPDVPTNGTILTLAVLKDGRGPVQKLLRTWALMEGNFLARYNEHGTPRSTQPRPAAK